MGNFGNGSPVPGMMGMGEGSNGQMDKRGAMGNVPTGPGHHNVRGGFRGRGRGGMAVRGRGGTNGESSRNNLMRCLILFSLALPLGPRSTIPNAPKGPKASRHRDALPEAQKAGLDYGGGDADPKSATEPSANVSTRAPLPSRQELTRERTPSESEDEGRRSKRASPRRDSRRNSPIKEEDRDREAAPTDAGHSDRGSDGGHSDARTEDRTRSSTGARRSTRDTRDSGSRSSQLRDSKTSADKARSDRYRSRDDRGGKDEKSRGSRRSSRSRERRRDDDRDKERKPSTRHHRSRSEKGGSAAEEDEDVKKETRRSSRGEDKS